MMEVAHPVAPASMDCYEDMFKEITRKLYGEEGLPDIEGAGGLVPPEYGGEAAEAGAAVAASLSSDLAAAAHGVVGHGSGSGALTAFGLAALMQNGFPPPPAMLGAHHHHLQEKYRASAAAAAAAAAMGYHPPPPLPPPPPAPPTGAGGGGGGAGPPGAGAAAGGPVPAAPAGSAPAANAPGGGGADDRWVASEDQLPWTSSKIATYNAAQKLFRCADCECVGFLARVAEHWLGTHANLRVFQCPQCPYASAWARCVRMHLTRQHNVPEDGASTSLLLKENPVLEEVTKYLQRLKTKVETSPPGSTKAHEYSPASHHPPPAAPRPPSANEPASGGATGGGGGGGAHHHAAAGGGNKRYCCSYCPYSTDRRDLFTRHENIHREEKPFQCYVCQKQFNRADHVKKHFLRMHRDYPYDLNRIRRQPPKNASGMSYYHKYNNNHIPGNNQPNGVNRDNGTPGGTHNASLPPPPPHPNMGPPPMPPHPHHNLNIPGGFPLRGGGGGGGGGGAGGVAGAGAGMKHDQSNKHMLGVNGCNAKSHISKNKKKADKRYSCCYCAWSGVDNWCLKRHLNTHLKPFVCVLCDYKAARSERLATHVLKVHNKRACGRCNFLADDQTQLSQHLQEHQHQGTGGSFPYGSPSGGSGISGSSGGGGSGGGSGGSHGAYSSHELVKGDGSVHGGHGHGHGGHGGYGSTAPSPRSPRPFGAARLFNYLEASDASDEEEEEEDNMTEPPMPIEEEPDDPTPFVCHSCGCEFADDDSLETHRMAHHRLSGGSSYAGSSYGAHSCAGMRTTRLRRVIRRRVTISGGHASADKTPFTCSVCAKTVATQTAMMYHMREHTGPSVRCRADDCEFSTPLGEISLREHVASAHQDGTPRCGHCGLVTDQMRRHTEIHHGGNGRAAGDPGAPAAGSSSKRRKQSQPRRLPPEDDAPTVRVRRRVLVTRRRLRRRRRSRGLRGVRDGRVRRRRSGTRCVARGGRAPRRRRSTTRGPAPTPEVQRLRDKHAGALLARGRRRCPWCRHMHAVTFPYHTAASLGLHDMWRHARAVFQCEHCDLRFRHRYQVVLHASREHVRANAPPVEPAAIVVPVVPANVCEPILSVPEPLKEPPAILCDMPSVPALPPPPSFSNMQVPDSLAPMGDKSHLHKDVNLRERPCAMEDSPTLNTPHPAPPPSVAPPPMPPASPPAAS